MPTGNGRTAALASAAHPAHFPFPAGHPAAAPGTALRFEQVGINTKLGCAHFQIRTNIHLSLSLSLSLSLVLYSIDANLSCAAAAAGVDHLIAVAAAAAATRF